MKQSHFGQFVLVMTEGVTLDAIKYPQQRPLESNDKIMDGSPKGLVSVLIIVFV